MTEKQRETKIKHCSGCYNDFYNGNNQYDVKTCWSLAGAKFKMRKEVHINQRPPWKQKPTKMLDCYRRPQYCFVDGDATH